MTHTWGRAGRGQRRAGLLARAGVPTPYAVAGTSCGQRASAAITTAVYGPARGGRGPSRTCQDRRSRACSLVHARCGSRELEHAWLLAGVVAHAHTRAAHAHADQRGRRARLGMVPTNGGTGSYSAPGSGGRPPRKLAPCRRMAATTPERADGGGQTNREPHKAASVRSCHHAALLGGREQGSPEHDHSCEAWRMSLPA